MSDTDKNQKEISYLEKYATDWVNLVVAGKYDQAATSFDSAVSAQITAAKLQEIWNSLISQLGAFKSIKGTKSSPYGAYNIVFVTCDFGKGALNLQLTLDAGGKIAGLFFQPPT
jgi:hypothetical protein